MTIEAAIRRALALLTLLVAFALMSHAAAQVVPGVPPSASAEAPVADQDLGEVLRAADEQGMRVIVIEPTGEAARAAPLDAGSLFSTGNFVELAGRVFDRLERLVTTVGEPDWPQPSSNPTKPLLNGVMTLLGLVVVWLAARAAGLRFSSRFGEEPAQDRPARVVAAVGGIAMACMLAIIPAFLVYGAGSKTIELVSWQIDLFASAALISLAVVAMMERVHDVAPAKRAEVEPRAVAQNINAVLTGLFLIVTAAQVLSFMYPEPEMAMLGAMVGVSAAAVALIWLAQRHRRAIAALVGTVLPRSRERVRQSAWAVFAFYVALSILIAFGRVILGMSEPVSLVLAPGTALLVGVF
ncbi:MAG: hypothetical protein AAFT19_07050, partial [Pseudomonadota bacterium]